MSFTLWRNDMLLGSIVLQFRGDNSRGVAGAFVPASGFEDISPLTQCRIEILPNKLVVHVVAEDAKAASSVASRESGANVLKHPVAKRITMSEKLLPDAIDDTYRGYKLALWLFGIVVSVRTAQSLAVIFNGYNIAREADGIPVDAYAPEASQQMVALFAQGSLWRLTFSLFCVLVLLRYRSAVPLMFAFLLLNYLASELIFRFVPLTRTGHPLGPYVNFGLFVLTMVGLVLSVRSQRAGASVAG